MVKVKADGTFYTDGDDDIIVQNFADGLRVWFDGEWRKPSAAFVGKDLNDNDIAMVIVGNRNLLFNHNLEFAQVRADIASWVEKRDANSMLPVIKVENGQVYVDGTLSTDVSDRYRSGVQVGGSSSNRMVKVHSDKSLHVDGAGRVEVKYVPGEGVFVRSCVVVIECCLHRNRCRRQSDSDRHHPE